MKKIITLLLFVITFHSFSQTKIYKDSLHTFNGIIETNNTPVYRVTNSFYDKVGVLKRNDTIKVLGVLKEETMIYAIVDYNNERGFIPKYCFYNENYFDTIMHKVLDKKLIKSTSEINSLRKFKTENSLINGELNSSLFYAYNKPNSYRGKKLFKLNEENIIPIHSFKKGLIKDYAVSILSNDSIYIEIDAFKNKKQILDIKEKSKYDNIKYNCHYYKNEKDEFTGDLKRYTEDYSLDNIEKYYRGEIAISLRKLNNEKFLWFYLNRDLGCASSYKRNRSYVKIKLENNQIVSFYHFGDTDCGDFSIVANLTKSDIYKLKRSPIKSIRLSGTKYYHDIKFVKWKTFFIDKLDCIK